MMNTLTFLVNDQVVHEVDRELVLADEQLAFLDNMDRSMDAGIKLYGELIAEPDIKQRATFVVMNLLRALQQENEAIASVSSAYLVNCCPSLAEVHAKDEGDKVVIELVEETLN
ncbi:MAG: hypothetical protein U9N50_14535 [Pseudomonadota bacterium]|nr:hypothetical protein [Pseudomonadota bacterium]